MSEKYNIPVLEEKYLKAKISYYEGKPNDLTDAEFDALEKILKEAGSKVVEQVGSKRKDFDFYHPTKMLSLNKIQTEETPEGINYMEGDFMKWYQKRKDLIGIGMPLLGSPKFDGNAINIIYRGGKLANIVTRSDAYTGKDITKRLQSKVPAELDLMTISLSENDVVEIRCEVVIKTKTFNEKYAEDFANPRNYVAGVIGADDEDEIKLSELDIMPLHYIFNGKQISQREFIKNTLFVSSYNLSFLAENYVETIKSYENLRKTFEYQLDGVVITFAPEYRDLLGENDHDPEWGIAIKFIPVQAVTKWIGYDWNNSKRGEIVPTNLLEPVFLDGSTVKRASGYNAAYLIEKKIGPGAVVSIAKAGDIIPEIQKVLVESETNIRELFPAVCPACGTPTEFDGVHLLCPNENCIGRIAKQLAGAVKILKLKKVGEKTIEPFAADFKNMYDLVRWVRTVGSTEEAKGVIEKYDIKYASRSYEIFINAFKNIKSLTYEQVIQMLGYDNVGNKISVQLAREHAGLDFNYANLEKALVAKLRSPEVSGYIKEVVTGLEEIGIVIDKPKPEVAGTVYFCLTGSPKEFGYKTKEEFMAKFPGSVEVSISDKKCQFLITDSYSSTSSKMGVATKKGIPIRTYGDFKL